jgi:hypothetical protein
MEQRSSGSFVAAPDGGVEAILDRFRPSLVVLGTSENPGSLAFPLVSRCAELDIPTVGVIDSPAAAAHRFRGQSSDALTHAPEWLLVAEEWTAGQYAQLGYPRERIVVCGHPHYDFVRAARERLAGGALRQSLYPQAPPGAPILLFAAELSTGLDPDDYVRSDGYTLTGRGDSVGRTEIVLEEFLDAVALQEPRPYCVLRLHPKNDPAQFTPYIPEFQQVSQKEQALEMIAGSDGVVGMTTMLLVEAVLLGKPTLSILPRDLERAWLPTTYFGLTPCATDRQAVRAQIARLVSERPVTDQEQVEAILPSGSLERAAEVIFSLLTPASPKARR